MKRPFFSFLLICMTLLSVACQDEAPLPTAVPVVATTSDTLAPPIVSEEPIVLPTETAVPPTSTPTAPLAARVNNEPLFLATFDAELARYEQAQVELGNDIGTNDNQTVVLDALIEQLLIRQAAEAAGVVVTDAMISQEMAELETVAGSAENFTAWLEANGYSEAEFRAVVASGMYQEQMVTAVTADVPFAVEQVHARYIQVENPELANTLLAQIQNGDDFATLARLHSLDRITGENGGDLGFFAAGSLLVPAVETAAFALTESGSMSEIVTAVNQDGRSIYYLVQLIERDLERPLDASVRSILLQQTFETWLNELWQAATIERLLENNS
ncbi:MAG: hypothetical protein GY805_02345 [Chloroflexi bacterium]|nr:hypothetical protein [Chloroflexota bacterium]